MTQEERNYLDVVKGMEFEKKNEPEKAIKLYEQLLDRNFDGSLPYDRLAILFRKAKNYEAEEITLKKAVSIFSKVAADGRSDGLPKLIKYQKRLETLQRKYLNQL